MESRLLERVRDDKGKYRTLMLFHISMKGLESNTLCSDEQDYDIMVKNIFLCARRHSVIVVLYCAVSNHAHIAVLAEKLQDAEDYVNDLKKVQSMWLRRKYGYKGVLARQQAYVSTIDTVRYARNMFAYIVRNAYDNGARNISDYPWSGYSAMFCSGKLPGHACPVKKLTSRSVERIFHTGDNLSDTEWEIDAQERLIPASCCYHSYLERIYNNDQSFFLKCIGTVNTSAAKFECSLKNSYHFTDTEFIEISDKYSLQWYGVPVRDLSPERKAGFIGYLNRMIRLTIPQVARCFNIQRSAVESLIKNKRRT